jgi:hypothetical protein
MKINASPETVAKIAAAVRPLAPLFECKSCDPKYNAQRNLEGRSYFVADENLRFHKSKVLSSCAFAGGLLFKVTESSSLDWHNMKRGVRVHVFDIFGTYVWGPDLENAKPRREQAERLFDDAEIDLAAHYKAALESKLYWTKDSEEKTKAALSAIA